MTNQSTSHLFMIEPESFNCNEQTASSNHYQEKHAMENSEDISAKALAEFHALKNEITKRGIEVTFLKGSKDCPDHIFPNWFITFEDKTMQIFSMMAPNRRNEKKPEMVEHLQKTYELTNDMSSLENENIFLESTSSMVFDRVNRCVYAGVSERTNKNQLINGRNFTNLGLFRNYIKNYLNQHPDINKKMTIMCRQLTPTPTGVPLEIYAFIKDKDWVNYEGIVSDIFDHLLASTSSFGLKNFEYYSKQ